MLIEVDFMSDEPIYRQIRAQIVRGVATGELQPGDALPSVRSLAGDLGVNMHTVNKAYAVLRDEGFVAMRGRSGAYVADGASKGERESEILSQLSRLAYEFRAQGGSSERFEALAAEAFRSSMGGDAS